MAKTFRPWDVNQAWLLPASVHDFVPPEHLAHLVREIVRDELDLTPILSVYDEERGQPPYHPAMMVALLLYAYSRGMYSSRQIARGCEERLDFQAVTALNRPDFRTISDFRQRHLEALAGLFRQVLTLCRRAGLVGFGHVALDGTKIKANASKNKAMSYARMGKAEADLAAEIDTWLAHAAAADASEDVACGSEWRGDEPPDWMRDKQKRLARIRTAKAELEAEAKAAADAKAAAPQRYRGGRKPKHPPGRPKPAAQRNFTDPDSHVMIGRDGFIQAYNAQAAVDGNRQIILAHRLSNNPDDHAALVPLIEAVKANTGRKPVEVSGDAGFCSHDNLAALHARKIRPYLATGRAGHPTGNGSNSRGGPPGADYARQTKARRATQPIPATKADRRTGLRPDQTGEGLPPVPPARHRQSDCRMGVDLHRSQSQQARHRIANSTSGSAHLAGTKPRHQTITRTGS
jgi:transposase